MLGDRFPHILEAARTGADWAWTSLYRDLAPSVLGYLRTRGALDPEDVTGEVFLQVVRDLSGFEGNERDFRAWVFTVAHHRLIDDTRRRARRPPESATAAFLEQDDAAAAETEVLAPIGARRVRDILERLSPDQRDVLLLRILGELTVDEVAKAVGKRTGAVKALQRRGLAALRQELDREGVTL